MENININCNTIGDEMNCIIPASEPFFTPFFSSGNIMISILIFILIVLKMIELLRSSIKNIKVKRTFISNNSPDGKEFYEI